MFSIATRPLIGSCGSAGSRNDSDDERQVQRPVGAVGEGAHARPHDHGVAGGLVHDHVALGARDRLLAPVQVGHLGDEVAHGARRDEEARLLPEQRGGALLERVDGRVVAEDVVADLRLRHRAPHGGSGVGDGVRAQVDPWHGPARISRLARARVWRPPGTGRGPSPGTGRGPSWARGVERL